MKDNETTEESYNNSKNKQIESFLTARYNTRYNIIKCRAEWKSKDALTLFHSIGRFELNTIKRGLDQAGVYTTSENIRSILESDFSSRVHPVQEYFNHLPRLDPLINRWIYRLSETVIVKNSAKWEEYLTKWLVGAVANALCDEKCLNHLCIVLTGEQGKFKTTWLDNLCPNSLYDYIYTGKIDPQNKDVQTLIAECLFINIDDQLKALNKKDENELKNYITMPKVKYRRPYDIYIEEYPHLASFMASVNGNNFLTDPTGSRRFLPFEVLSIDIKKAKTINMEGVYSETLFLLENGYKYWFSDKEVDELNESNRSFQVQTTEFEMLMRGFEVPTDLNKDKYFKTNAEIRSYLTRWTGLKLREKQMGEALASANIPKSSKYRAENGFSVSGYILKEVVPNPFIDKSI